MPARIRITLLTVLILFAMVAFVYVRSFVDPRPHGIILFVVEGLGVEMLQAGRLYAAESGSKLVIEQLPHTGLASVHSSDNLVPDSAASATALSTGVKTPNGSIGIDSQDKRLNNLLYTAQRRGRATGLISNSDLTCPGAAAFYSHVPHAQMRQQIAEQALDSAHIDIVLGGGADFFLPVHDGTGYRDDGRDLVKEAEKKGYAVVRTADALEGLFPWLNRRVLGLFSQGDFAYQADLEHWFPNQKRPTNQPRLSDMVRKSIRLLETDIGGYFLIVHSGLIGSAAENNQAKRALLELSELDEALKTALDYSGKRTTVVVASTHSCGGPKIAGDAGISLSSTTPPDDFWTRFTWVSGPSAQPSQPADIALWKSKNALEVSPSKLKSQLLPWSRQQAFLYREKALGSAEDVIVAGQGPGTDALRGFLDNTAIFQIIGSQL